MQSAVAFIIARPQNDAGVAAELAYDGGYLLVQLFFEAFGFGVGVARHSEILPHHYAVSVAIVEELVILVDVTAPSADDVAVCILEEGEGFVVTLGIARVEGVKRHPVRALAHDLYTVDEEAELSLFAVEGIFPFKLYVTNTEGHRTGVDEFPVFVDPRFALVEICVSVADGPPFLGVGDVDAINTAEALLDGNALFEAAVLSASKIDLQLHAVKIERVGFKHIEEAIVLPRVIDLEIRLGETNFVSHLKAHLSPKSRRHGAAHDVPAAAVRGFAQVAQFGLAAEDELMESKILSLSVKERRAQVDLEGVFPLLQILVDAELMRDVHVFALADQFTVQIVFGNAIHALEDKIDVVFLLGCLEGSFVPPFVVLKLLGFEDVVAHIKIRGKIALTR